MSFSPEVLLLNIKDSDEKLTLAAEKAQLELEEISEKLISVCNQSTWLEQAMVNPGTWESWEIGFSPKRGIIFRTDHGKKIVGPSGAPRKIRVLGAARISALLQALYEVLNG